MPRQGLTKDIIISRSVDIINQLGYQNLTFTILANELNVQPPAMFKHFKNMDDLKAGLTLRAITGLKLNLKNALIGVSGGKAIISLCHAYRDFAKNNKGLYKAMQPTYFKEKDIAREATELMSIITSVLRGFNIEELNFIHLIRLIRSSLHGFVILEIDYNFGITTNIDESFEHQIKAILFMVNSFGAEF